MQAAEQSHDDAPKLMKREALYYTSGLAPTPTVVPRPHSFGGELWSQTPKATLLPAVAAVTRHTAATDQVKSLHAILRKKFKNEKILHVPGCVQTTTPGRSLSLCLGRAMPKNYQ